MLRLDGSAAIAVVPDGIQLIADEVFYCAPTFDFVVTSGGVGPTHETSLSRRSPALSETRLGRKRRELKLVCPARPVLGMQVIERFGDLRRIHHDIRSLLSHRQRPSSR
jgi:hypothetical protein